MGAAPSLWTAAARLALALLLLLLCVLPTHAAWTPVNGTESSYDYVDLSSVRVEGTVRRVWTLHDLTQPDHEGDLSYRSLLEYHCPEARYRSLQTLFFAGAMGSGRMTARSGQPGAWRAVQPDSVSASVMKAVCRGS
jgi:hypothetical protein